MCYTNPMTTNTLVSFLEDRLTEDRLMVAEAMKFYQHVLGTPHYFDPRQVAGFQSFPSSMVAMNPKVALAEIKAKQTILDWFVSLDTYGADEGYDEGYWDALWHSLKVMVRVYSEHPDYDHEWDKL